MKRLMLTLAVLSLAIAFDARAGEPASLSMNCPANALPRHDDVVRVFDEHNLGKVYELRQRLRTQARLECRAGAARVRIVAAPTQAPVVPVALAKR